MAKKSGTKFDPYWEWLKIPPEQQPPHHYRLLGLKVFEAETELIENSVTRLVERFHRLSQGPHVAAAQQILNQVAQARLCLNDPQKKLAYDTQLRARLSNPPAPKSARVDSGSESARPAPKSSRPSSAPAQANPPRKPERPATPNQAAQFSNNDQAKQVHLMKIASAAMLVLGGVVGFLFVWFAFGGKPVAPSERLMAQGETAPVKISQEDPAAVSLANKKTSSSITTPPQNQPPEGDSSGTVSEDSDAIASPKDTFAEAVEKAAQALDVEPTEPQSTSATSPPPINTNPAPGTSIPAAAPTSIPLPETTPPSSTTDSGPREIEGLPGTYFPAPPNAFSALLKEVIGVQGEVQSLRTSVSGKTVYLMFAPVKNELIEVRARASSISLEDLGPFVGKNVRVRGVLKAEFGSNTPGIEIEALSQIEVIQP